MSRQSLRGTKQSINVYHCEDTSIIARKTHRHCEERSNPSTSVIARNEAIQMHCTLHSCVPSLRSYFHHCKENTPSLRGTKQSINVCNCEDTSIIARKTYRHCEERSNPNALHVAFVRSVIAKILPSLQGKHTVIARNEAIHQRPSLRGTKQSFALCCALWCTPRLLRSSQ